MSLGPSPRFQTALVGGSGLSKGFEAASEDGLEELAAEVKTMGDNVSNLQGRAVNLEASLKATQAELNTEERQVAEQGRTLSAVQVTQAQQAAKPGCIIC